MEWLNIHSSTLDSPAMVGAEPIDRATWLFLQRFCVGQENGGIIRACREWGDRRWQQSVRVTLREVRRASELWTWDGDDLHVHFYPVEKEHLVRTKREAGRIGGQATTEAKSAAARRNGAGTTQADTQAQGQANTQAHPKHDPSTDPREGKEKGREVEMEGNGREVEGAAPQPDLAGLAPAADPIVQTFSTAGKESTWHLRESYLAQLVALFPAVDVRAEVAKAHLKIERGMVAKKTARGMEKFLMGWMERTQNSARPPAAGLREKGKYADSF